MYENVSKGRISTGELKPRSKTFHRQQEIFFALPIKHFLCLSKVALAALQH